MFYQNLTSRKIAKLILHCNNTQNLIFYCVILLKYIGKQLNILNIERGIFRHFSQLLHACCLSKRIKLTKIGWVTTFQNMNEKREKKTHKNNKKFLFNDNNCERYRWNWFPKLVVGNKFNRKNLFLLIEISAWWISMEFSQFTFKCMTHAHVNRYYMWSCEVSLNFSGYVFSQSNVAKVFSHSCTGVQSYNPHFVSCCRLFFIPFSLLFLIVPSFFFASKKRKQTPTKKLTGKQITNSDMLVIYRHFV